MSIISNSFDEHGMAHISIDVEPHYFSIKVNQHKVYSGKLDGGAWMVAPESNAEPVEFIRVRGSHSPIPIIAKLIARME